MLMWMPSNRKGVAALNRESGEKRESGMRIRLHETASRFTQACPIQYEEVLYMTGECSISKALDRLRGDRPRLITTADILRERDGRFTSNVGVSVGQSPNAREGRVISSRARDLGLRRVRKSVSVRDSFGHRTTAALWELPARGRCST